MNKKPSRLAIAMDNIFTLTVKAIFKAIAVVVSLNVFFWIVRGTGLPKLDSLSTDGLLLLYLCFVLPFGNWES